MSHAAESPPPVAEEGFEAHVRRLEELVARLERDDMPLDEAMVLYEQGVALARRCQELLEAAELKLRHVDANGRDGSPVTL
jgi:exodeoxyribonuclease VII small subunit